jgi:hypothetical protein
MSTQRRENRWQRTEVAREPQARSWAGLGSFHTIASVRTSCNRHGWNGPAAQRFRCGPVGWPQTLCNRITAPLVQQFVWLLVQDIRQFAQFAAQGAGNRAARHTSDSQVILPHIPPLPVSRVSIPPCRRSQQANAAGRKGTMAKEICISSTPHETRLAILEDDQLAEIYYERENEYTLAGSIYNGRVTRVLPGMQSAFVDVGLERDAFLYVTDFLELEDPEETDELEKAAASGGNQPPREVRHMVAARGRPRPGAGQNAPAGRPGGPPAPFD